MKISLVFPIFFWFENYIHTFIYVVYLSCDFVTRIIKNIYLKIGKSSLIYDCVWEQYRFSIDIYRPGSQVPGRLFSPRSTNTFFSGYEPYRGLEGLQGVIFQGKNSFTKLVSNFSQIDFFLYIT